MSIGAKVKGAALAALLVGATACGSQPAAAPVTSTVSAVRTSTVTSVSTAVVTTTAIATETETSKITVTVAPPAPKTFTLSGTLELTDAGELDASCAPTDGYRDIQAGASVTVYDSKTAIIATGILGPGDYDAASGVCSYSITVEDVPADSTFYQVEITHRGKVTVSAAEAKAGLFGATLGS